jgi:hypothetical protein
MGIVRRLGVFWLFSGLAISGCGDSNHESEDLSHLTPAEVCQKKCDLQVAANCTNTPADYATSCALICEAKYQKFPNCAAQANALDACSIQRVSYSCMSGTISGTPEGACAAQGLACGSCTGDFLQCL